MRRFTLVPFLLLALPALAQTRIAQSPLLEISPPVRIVRPTPHGPAPVWRVLLTNNYTAPVSAYAIRFTYGGRPGGARMDDAVPSPSPHTLLSPGAVISIILPGARPVSPTVQNTAVIYANGATAGEPAVVASFLCVRAIFLGELPIAIAKLQALARDPRADRTAAVADFQQEQLAEVDLLRGPGVRPHWRVPPRVAGSVVATLQHNPHQSVQATANGFIDTFEKWRSQLQNSLPKLTPAAFPSAP